MWPHLSVVKSTYAGQWWRTPSIPRHEFLNVSSNVKFYNFQRFLSKSPHCQRGRIGSFMEVILDTIFTLVIWMDQNHAAWTWGWDFLLGMYLTEAYPWAFALWTFWSPGLNSQDRWHHESLTTSSSALIFPALDLHCSLHRLPPGLSCVPGTL